MVKTLIYFIPFLLYTGIAVGQDSEPIGKGILQDTIRQVSTPSEELVTKDTLTSASVYPDFILKKFDNRQAFLDYLLTNNMLYPKVSHPLVRTSQIREEDNPISDNQAALFYVLLGIFFFLAVVHAFFRKYFSDLFQAFISPTLSRRQLKEQLHQTPFPGLILNLFFTISMGAYLFLVLRGGQFLPTETPLYVMGLFVLFFIIIYLIKYVTLRFFGWILKMRETIDGYIFTIFLLNKILGLVLLPFIIVLAFSSLFLWKIVLGISFVFIVILFIYRYLRAYPTINSFSKINKFHFFIYLCALEIVPILIIGKVFMIWMRGI